MLFRRIVFSLILFLVIYYYLQPLKTGRGTDRFVKYEIVKAWPQLPKDFVLGNPAGIGIDTS